jgi:RND family efflux transporter MFP subunit
MKISQLLPFILSAFVFNFSFSETPILLTQADIARVKPSSYAKEIHFTGTLKPSRQVILNTKTSGEILSMSVNVGDEVKEGELIFKIDTKDLELIERQSKAALDAKLIESELAKRKLKQVKKLAKDNFASSSDLDSVNDQYQISLAQVQSAKASLERIQQQIQDAQLYAPFSGVIAERQADVGQNVASGTPIGRLVDVASLELEAYIPVEEAQFIEANKLVQFFTPNSIEPYSAHVKRISPVAKQDSRKLPVFIIAENPNKKLMAGMFVTGKILTDNAPLALEVPTSSLRKNASEWEVIKIDGTVIKPIKVRLIEKDNGNGMAIISTFNPNSLTPEDSVLMAPQSIKNTDNRSVQITQVE